MSFIFQAIVAIIAVAFAAPLLIACQSTISIKQFIDDVRGLPLPIVPSPIILPLEDMVQCFKDSQESKGDPDIKRTTPEVIKAHGYPVETHTVTTKDDYILTMFRIPYGKKESSSKKRRKAVLLSHGLLGSSAQYFFQRKRNLAMKLANAGYDVWLANNRGTSYSINHVSLTENDAKYWDFSWHEMGVYDLPAMIDYILEETGNSKLYFVGHSQGSTQLLVALAENEEYNDKIEVAFLMAPVGFLSHSTNILRQITFPLQHGQYLTNPLLQGKLQMNLLAKYFNTSFGEICANTQLTCALCETFLILLYGHDGPQMDYTRVDFILSKVPDSVSVKCIIHYSQTMSHTPASFRQFDYLLPGENEKRYGQGVTEPPDYNLSKVTAKVVAFYGDKDNFGTPKDAKITFKKLNNKDNELVRVDWPLWHHADFSYAKDADIYVYNYILEVMSK